MSQNTSFKLFVITASAVEIQVLTGTIISLFFKFRDLSAISIASVPLPKLTQYFALTNFEKFFSKFSTSLPPTNFEFFINEFTFEKIFVFLESAYKDQ